MSNYNTSASVTLTVNGKQAQNVLKKLQSEATSLEQKIARASVAGDKATMQKLQRELRNTQNLMSQLQTTTKNVEQVMSRLDSATPKELNRTLRTLQSQLNGIERGSEAWNAHTAKIKAVKAELAKVNSELATQKSLWSRFNGWLNEFSTAIMGVSAAVAGLTMAGRKAVNSYAEMEEELTDTRKYTGLTKDAVLELNEAFKKMDTRTPRDKLNELAQEAGRLGYNTLESVQGYVEAADIINVALVDLGEGATQTIAKLTNIFGVQDLLGTRDAMLSVGSTVNVLSQNCTAGKPFIVEFAQRMAGIGAQAKLTIPQIMAFAATLDANGQKCEMSASALSRLIMLLFQKPKEIASQVGLDVEKFTQTLKTSTNEGVLMFLERLKQIGDKDALAALAPLFKDLGMDGVRMSQVLANLATHLDMVKWEQEEANKAFTEASSATKEYAMFNNTAQASIDKAKKRVTELAIELGEKLYPVMKHIYTSSGIFMRVLNTMVDFFIKYRKEIITATAAIAAYNIVLLLYNTRTALATKATTLFGAAIKLCKGAIPALRLVITPLINTIQYFTNGLEVNYAMQERWRKAMEGMKFSSWVGLIVAVGAAVYTLASRFKSAHEEAEKMRKEQEEYQKSLTDISQATAEYSQNEELRLRSLYEAATDESKSKDDRRKAAEKLQALYPDYFKNLSIEEIMVGKARVQYEKLRDSIIEVARARAAADKIKENETKLLTLQEEQPKLAKARDAAKKNYDAAVTEWNAAMEQENNTAYLNSSDAAAGQIVTVRPKANKVTETGNTYNAANSAYQRNLRQQKQLNDSNKFLRDTYKVAADATYEEPSTPNVDLQSLGGGGHSGGGGGLSTTDKFKKEQDARDRAEASARISYATGETDYIKYTEEMNQILVDFYKSQLEHTDLSETERLQITAQYWEAVKKQTEQQSAENLEKEQSDYNKSLAEAKQFYIDGQYSKDTYNQKVEELEMEHQKKLISLTAEGSKERLQAEEDLRQLQITQMERRQQEAEKLQAKFDKMKADYFGDNPKEQKAKYDEQIKLLEDVYNAEVKAAGDNAEEKLRIEKAFQKAKLALQKQYGQLAEVDTRNSMQKAVDSSIEWLNSDGGKAMTGTMSTLVSGMSSIFSQLSSIVQAELEIQTAAIEKRYEKEISLAEGNSYKTKKLEEEKEAEIAKAKQEANRKLFAMQVIQAVAQTAQNAINAYGSAAAIPVTGFVLAPIAASMAVAAGMLQIAAIKKQQQASEAQGYSEGGFTPDGAVDEVAGVVHAGEWVASQKLTKNPNTRPLLEALEYAQRTNTVGSLTAADVSRSITAPIMLASQQQTAQPTIVTNNTYNSSVDNAELSTTIRELKDRLSEPFVTVNTVSGDYGMLRAQEEYERLMKNKSPKSRK
jgi:TP901 family phage tail tape measure protein